MAVRLFRFDTADQRSAQSLSPAPHEAAEIRMTHIVLPHNSIDKHREPKARARKWGVPCNVDALPRHLGMIRSNNNPFMFIL